MLSLFLYRRKEHMRLSFYRTDEKYCNYLREIDFRVPYTMDKKQMRPFVGVVLEINGLKYYAPLSSPKPKHRSMKNQIDFMKINNGTWGAINFNNMIPVHEENLIKIEMRGFPTDTKKEMEYKNLLQNQLSWCNSNRKLIISSAIRLYETITQGKGRQELLDRCCDFKRIEKRYIEYGRVKKE